ETLRFSSGSETVAVGWRTRYADPSSLIYSRSSMGILPLFIRHPSIKDGSEDSDKFKSVSSALKKWLLLFLGVVLYSYGIWQLERGAHYRIGIAWFLIG